jgi:hypothetical protein
VSASSLNRNGSDGERDRQVSSNSTEPDGSDHPEIPLESERPLFQHQPWMAGIVLVFAAAAIVAGLTNPVWWLIGSPFILALVLYIGVRLAARK